MMSSATKRKRDEAPATKTLVSADKVSLAINAAKEQLRTTGSEPPTKKPANETTKPTASKGGAGGGQKSHETIKPLASKGGAAGGQKSLYTVAANLSSLKTAPWKPPVAAPEKKQAANPPAQRPSTAAAAAPNRNSPQNPESSDPASFIDEVINEADDLLQAAREAQSLGRLRSASSYLLLAHARLVGLGRRFDRSRCLEDEAIHPSNTPTEVAGVTDGDDSNATILQPPNKTRSTQRAIVLPPMPVANNALSDVALMEHLARAGMELHHKRTGRGMQHDAQIQKQAQSLIPLKKPGGGKEEEEETPTKRKGGRGKKPPTLVMHTLLGAELDGKKLMKINP